MMSHYDCKDCHASPGEPHAADCRRTTQEIAMTAETELPAGPVPVAYQHENIMGANMLSFRPLPRGADELGWTETPLSPTLLVTDLLDALREAVSGIESGELDDLLCCGGGSECGCRGSTKGQLLAHNLRAAIAKAEGRS